MRQKTIFILLSVLGLVCVLSSIAPEILGSGKKGFGQTQFFLLRNGIVILIAGLIPLFFPRLFNYLKQAFNDNAYQQERKMDLTTRSSFSKYDFIVLLSFLIASNLFARYIVGMQHYIFNWDSAIFSGKYAEISTTFKDNPLNAVKVVLGSIERDHYNYFAPFLLMPFSLSM